MASQSTDYPPQLTVKLGDAVYAPGDVAALKAGHGPLMVVLCRSETELQAVVAPVEIVGLGVMGRCTKLVASSVALELIDAAELTMFAGRAQILVCTPAMSGAKAQVLIEMVRGELGYFRERLPLFQALDAALAVGAPLAERRVREAVEDLVRYLSAETKKYRQMTHEITFPTGDWNVYDHNTPNYVSPDRLALAIKSYAARSLHVNHPLPQCDAGELDALLTIIEALRPTMDSHARALAMTLCESPMFARLLLKRSVSGRLNFRWFDRESRSKNRYTSVDTYGSRHSFLARVVDHLLIEEYTHAALRSRAETTQTPEEPGFKVTSADYLAMLRTTATALPYRNVLDRDVADYRALAGQLRRGQNDVAIHVRLALLAFEYRERGIYPFQIYDGVVTSWTRVPTSDFDYRHLCTREEKQKRIDADDKKLASRRPDAEKAGIAVPADVTPDMPYVLTLGQVVDLGLKSVPGVDEAFHRLDMFVGGYLAELDLSRTLITGSAIAAALMRMEYSDRSGGYYSVLARAEYLAADVPRMRSPTPTVYTLSEEDGSASEPGSSDERGSSSERESSSKRESSSEREQSGASSEQSSASSEREKPSESPAPDTSPKSPSAGIKTEYGWNMGYQDNTALLSAYPHLKCMREISFHDLPEFTGPMKPGVPYVAYGERKMTLDEWLASAASQSTRDKIYAAWIEALYPPTKTPLSTAEQRHKYLTIVSTATRTGTLPAIRVDDGMVTVTIDPPNPDLLDTELEAIAAECREAEVPIAVRLPLESGADLDMAVDCDTEAEFDAIVQAHYQVVKRHHPHALLTRGETRHSTWKISCGDVSRVATFRPVELYRANFGHVVSHHVGMVSGAFTARFAAKPEFRGGSEAPGETNSRAEFVFSARLLYAMVHGKTPNYYYFASRKYQPQEIIMKYYARGFEYDSFPLGLVCGINMYSSGDPKWGGCLPLPATFGSGNFSVFSLATELSLGK